MTSARVATWNVLHWVHDRNHDNDLPDIPAKEDERAQAVVDRIVTIDAEITCLQEVSGDTLKMLVDRHGTDRVHSFRLPRMPKLKQGTNVLRDGWENLVIITNGNEKTVHAQSFDDDDGKGFIAIRRPDGSLVVCTHVSGDPDKSRLQLRSLDDWISTQRGAVVLCGDFNMDFSAALDILRPGWHAATVRSATNVSRPKSNQLIDHILSWNWPDLTIATIEDGSGISDHNIVVIGKPS